jgi:hypothetical protein
MLCVDRQSKKIFLFSRGISLQNCIAKLFSSALNKRLMSHYENLFSSQQFGFRPHHLYNRPLCQTVSNALCRSTKQENIFVFFFKTYLDIRVFKINTSAWRKSFIILIHKSGDKSDLNNYRGISLQNCIVKLFSSALNKRLKLYNFTIDLQVATELYLIISLVIRSGPALFWF